MPKPTMKPSVEYHIHIDIFDDGYDLTSTLSNLQQQINFQIISHNFNHYLTNHPTLSIFHGSEPEQHFSIRHNFDNLKEVEDLTQKIFLAISNNSQPFKGYVEYETVFYEDFSDFGTELKFPVIPQNLFDNIIDTQLISVNNDTKYLEFHWTVPTAFVEQSLELFQKSKLKGVSILKNNIQCIVLTSLFPDIESMNYTYSQVTALGFGSVKKEYKQYRSNQPITMRQAVTKAL